MKKFSIVGAVLLIFGLFLLWRHSGEKETAVGHSSALEPQRAPSADTAHPGGRIGPSAALPQGAKLLRPTHLEAGSEKMKMGDRLSLAHDYREFAYAAMQAPERGGYFYAGYVANLCGFDQSYAEKATGEGESREIISTGTVSSKQLKAAEMLKFRCAGFSRGEATELFLRIKSLSADGRDPFVSAQKNFSEAVRKANAIEIQAALTRLFAHDDPLIVSDIGALLRASQQSAAAAKLAGFYYNGKFYTDEGAAEYTVVSNALQLAACHNIGPCQIDEEILQVCAISGACFDDRVSFAIWRLKKSGYVQISESDIRSKIAEMQQKISSGEVGAFFGTR